MLNQAVVESLTGGEAQLTVPAMVALMLYPWPGGEAELREGLAEARRQAAGRRIDVGHLPRPVQEVFRAAVPPGERPNLLECLSRQAEAALLAWGIQHSGLSREALARELGITRSALYKKLQRLGIPYRR